MNDDPNKDSGRAISGQFELSSPLSTARTFRITGYLFTDDTLEDILKRVAVAQEVVDVQQIRMDIIAKEAEMAQTMAVIAGHQEQAAKMMEKRNKGKKLTSQEQLVITNLDATLTGGQQRLESLQAAVKAAKAKLNGAAPAA
jgi:hypothetical protein